ncbi:hypothetical protein ACQKO6_13805 [Pseudomonas monteilii]
MACNAAVGLRVWENPLSRCVADATGGRVYAARDRQALAQGLQQATEEVARQPECAR